MNGKTMLRHLLVWFTIGTSIASVPALADDRSIPVAPPERWIATEEALARPVNARFDETALLDAIEDLASQARVKIDLDEPELEVLGIGTNSPLTFRSDRLSLAATLERILRPLELHYVVEHGGLLITSQTQSQRRLESRVYDVGDLAGDDWTSLVFVMQETIEPDAWEENGGVARIAEFPKQHALVVAAPRHIQNQVAGLFAALRFTGGKHRSRDAREGHELLSRTLGSRGVETRRARSLPGERFSALSRSLGTPQ